MKKTITTLFACFIVAAPGAAFAQADDNEELKITALEALISAPPERALPIAQRVLEGEGSDELKSRALFILSQIDEPASLDLLNQIARSSSGELQLEAIRMLGINGHPTAIAGLADIYAGGDGNVKEAVLEAYLIADNPDAIYEIAVNTENPEEFENAVEMLGAMGATDQLRNLRERRDMSEQLVEAYAIAGATEELKGMAMDASDPVTQLKAIEALGIVGGPEVDALLVEIYRSNSNPDIREAALHGMLIAGHDQGVLDLFRESNDATEKKQLLEMLVMMDSDAVWDIVDSTLEQ
jgi:HEAT repeat protein